jgi:ParB/RepB/Spo0J family partition protein
MEFIKDYKIDNIQPWERNPRKNDKAVKKLVPLLKEHGFINPVIIDQEGILRAGHTRVKAAIELGMETVPALIVNFKDVEHAIAYAIADNKSNDGNRCFCNVFISGKCCGRKSCRSIWFYSTGCSSCLWNYFFMY